MFLITEYNLPFGTLNLFIIENTIIVIIMAFIDKNEEKYKLFVCVLKNGIREKAAKNPKTYAK